MRVFAHIHHSSRYDRTPASLRHAVLGFSERASIMTLTEVAAEQRERAILIPGWGVLRGDKSGRDDCAILWNRKDWAKVWGRTYELRGHAYRNAQGRIMSPPAAATVVLKHRETGKTIVISVAHLQSGVEGKNGWSRRIARVRAWRDALRNWRRHWNRVSRRYDADATILVADWNLDLKKIWVYLLLKAQMPTFRFTWGRKGLRKERGGTHGDRIIDFTLIRGRLGIYRRPYILPKHYSSDHKPYRESLRIK